MHFHPPDEQFIPLSEASKYAGVTPEHLNLLVREGKLKAEKLGRNWFTTKKWIAQYFGEPRIDTDSERISTEIKLREIEKEEKAELARIRADVQKKQIEKEEKLELARLANRRSPAETEPFVLRAAERPPKTGESPEADEVLGLLGEVLRKFNSEKENLAAMFDRELGAIRDSRRLEQGERRALIFAFENLQVQVREDIERRVSELAEELNEKLAELVMSARQASLSLPPRQEAERIAENLREQSEAELKALLDENENLTATRGRERERLKSKLYEGERETGSDAVAAFARLKTFFSGNLIVFPAEPAAYTSLNQTPPDIIFKTKFLRRAISPKELNLAAREVARKLLVSEWKRESAGVTATHYFAKHRKFEGSTRPISGAYQRLPARAFAGAVLAVLAGLFVFLSLAQPGTGTATAAKIENLMIAFATKPLAVAVAGEKLGELVVESVKEGMGELFVFAPRPGQADKNIAAGSLESAAYILRGAHSLIAESRLLNGKEARNFELALSKPLLSARRALYAKLDSPLIGEGGVFYKYGGAVAGEKTAATE